MVAAIFERLRTIAKLPIQAIRQHTRHSENDSRHYVRAFVPIDALSSIRLFK